MKKFDDLIFEQHDFGIKNMRRAKMTFSNGNKISVIGGGPTYGDGVDTFEVMDHEGEVHGYLSKHEVTEIMFKTQGNMLNSIKKLKWTDL